MLRAFSACNQVQRSDVVNENPNDYIHKQTYDGILLELDYKVTKNISQ